MASPPESGQVDQPVGTGSPEDPVEDQVQGEGRNDQEQRGEQPLGPAGPERAQVDPTRTVPFLEQERRDEKAGQNEEQVDPQVPPEAQPSCRWYATTPSTATPRSPLSAGRCRPVTAVVSVAWVGA